MLIKIKIFYKIYKKIVKLLLKFYIFCDEGIKILRNAVLRLIRLELQFYS